MTYAHDIPGYLQGHRFSDDPRYYDADRKYFRDLAGFDRLNNGLTIVNGSPVFITDNGHRCLKVDNTFNGAFPPATPFEGTQVIVAKVVYNSGAERYYIHTYGNSLTPTDNGRLEIRSARIAMNSQEGISAITETLAVRDGVVYASSFDQTNSRWRATRDGGATWDTDITIASPSTVDGNQLALTASVYPGNVFGALDGGNTANLTEKTDLYAHVWEQHFFEGFPMETEATKFQAWVAGLREKYGM